MNCALHTLFAMHSSSCSRLSFIRNTHQSRVLGGVLTRGSLRNFGAATGPSKKTIVPKALTQDAGWESCGMHDLAHRSSVGSVQAMQVLHNLSWRKILDLRYMLWAVIDSTGHLTRNRKAGPGWISYSYLRMGAFHTNFSIITTPQFLILL